MDIVKQFRELNPQIPEYESMDLTKAKEALKFKLNWDFLPASARNVIERNSLSTLEIIDLLYVYKFVEAKDLIEMVKYALHFDTLYLDCVKVPESFSDLCEKLDVLVERDMNGVDLHVYMGLHKIQSEAAISVELVGRKIIFHYLLPINYEMLKDPDYMNWFGWDYHALFNRYMQYCIDEGASDFHFDVSHVEKRAKYRSLVRIGSDRKICDLFEITSRMNSEMLKSVITERSSNKGAVLDLDNNRGVVVDIKNVFGDGRLDVRFEANKVYGGYFCVCRLQEQKTISLTIDKLGFSAEDVKLLRDNCEKPSGLTLFTGKIRTGKNTTMSAVANEIVQKVGMPSIISFDDPIEILGKFPQVDYRGDISALRSYIRLAKKQDLDFCMINEIPNAEVAFGVRDLTNSSIHTMTTWHMNRLWHLAHKLFEYFGEAYRDVLSQINLVCNQRLYKRQCGFCQSDVHRDNYVNDKRIYQFFVEYDLFSSKVSQGCEKCGWTGFSQGEIVVLPEILKFDQDLVLELFSVDRPYEMERIILNKVRGSQFSLEYKMKEALMDGRLSPQDVLSIV